MENTIQIQPFHYQSITQISKPIYIIDEITRKYTITIKAYTEENQHVRDFTFEISQEEFDAWGSGEDGDDYIKNLILSKLGFQEVV